MAARIDAAAQHRAQERRSAVPGTPMPATTNGPQRPSPRTGKTREPALVCALAAGRKATEAAAELGISETTIKRRLRDPEFRRAVDEARQEMIERTIGGIAAAGVRAVEVLVELMESADADYVRLGAAQAILTRLPIAKALDRPDTTEADIAKANVLSLVHDARRPFGA